MAKSYDNNSAPGAAGPKKAAPTVSAAPGGNTALAQAQRRAQAMARGPQVTPAQFFQEAWVELKKTSWPNRDTLVKSTTVVLALVVAVAIWVGVIDAGLTHTFNLLFSSAAHTR